MGTDSSLRTRGLPAIAKRIPPSQRPERKLDDTARAIARNLEEAKPDKPRDPAATASYDPKAKAAAGSVNQGFRRQKPGGAAPVISTKRPKTGGA